MNRIIQAGDVISRRIGDEIVVIKEDGSATHVLNKTAAAIWELCDGEHSLDDIAARLCERFEITFDEVRRDTGEIIDRWLELGILGQSGKIAAEGGEGPAA
jgi:pyrroloquinoline quinone biosynthesis protein D